MKPSVKPLPDKYWLYERAVQSPKTHIDWSAEVFHQLRGRYARVLREDFCGTFQLSCQWVKRNRANHAIAVDLDIMPLLYGIKTRLSKMTKSQRRRLKLLKADVCKVKTRLADIVLVGNFSFFIFKERKKLIEYFRAVRRGLSADGVVMLEMAGGAGMIRPMREQRTFSRGKKKLFTYIWHQRRYDPITHDAEYSIHFKLPDGRKISNAFNYDWRLWTIREVREALMDAGFSDTCVYWESEHQGEGTGEYLRSETADNAYAWIAYVIGMR